MFTHAMKAMHGQNKKGLANPMQSDTSNIDNRQGLKKSWQWKGGIYVEKWSMPWVCLCQGISAGGKGKEGVSSF